MIIYIFIALFFSFVMPQPTTVEEKTKHKVLELAAINLADHLDPERYQIELSVKWIPNSVLQVGPHNIRAVTAIGTIREYTRFNLIYQTRAGRSSTQIQLKIKAEQYVLVATERIKRNELADSSMFHYKWVKIKLGRDQFVYDLAELNNKSIRKNLLPGQAIRVQELSKKVVINPGDAVTMRYSKGFIKLALSCEARQSGAKGEQIGIYCQETRKKYDVKIIGKGEVQWVKTQQ